MLIILGHGGSVGYFSHAAVKFEDMISHQKVQSKVVSHFTYPILISAKFVPSMCSIFVFILQCVAHFDYLDRSK